VRTPVVTVADHDPGLSRSTKSSRTAQPDHQLIGRHTVAMDDRSDASAGSQLGPPVQHRLVVVHGEASAHELLRHEVARFHQVPASAVVLTHDCLRCGSNEHGQPQVLPTATIRHPAYVSLARAGDLAVVAITEAGPVGIDVEAVDAADFHDFATVGLHPDEIADTAAERTRTWVRKEALLKAYGTGLAIDPRAIRLDDDGLAAWDSEHPAPGAVWLREVPIAGMVAAVAVLPVGRADIDQLSVIVRPVDGERP
jgi:phosphopantetheinyl transferase